MPKPPIVTICGSMRFETEMHLVARELTHQGRIVLMPHKWLIVDSRTLDLQMSRIDLSDSIVVVSDASGYIGDHTRQEIAYAATRGKPIERIRVGLLTHLTSRE